MLTNSFLKHYFPLVSRTEHSSDFLPLPLAACFFVVSSCTIWPKWNSSRAVSAEPLFSCYILPPGDPSHLTHGFNCYQLITFKFVFFLWSPVLCIWLPTWQTLLGCLKGTTNLAYLELNHDLPPQTVSSSYPDHKGFALPHILWGPSLITHKCY